MYKVTCCLLIAALLWAGPVPAHGKEPRVEKRTPNRLVREKSPYLLQHAYNPVDWYPWGREAFERAKREDKPVFLSIGYSTCHWCHVMEKESFEDPEVARLLNEAFVCIKVDREERPDLDHVYMAVCQAMTGSGGWPLTILMTPDKKPFFAATYIPKKSRFGRPGLEDLVPRVVSIWKDRRGEVLRSSEEIVEALDGADDGPAGPRTDLSVLKRAFQELRNGYDRQYGGFGDAPKFPTAHQFFFLLRYGKREHEPLALEMTERTLEAMRLGGIYDQLGYGFHRYATDREWLVPHFEKMLYDQAMLALAFLETFQATGKATYAETAREIFTYVLRDMTDPGGGFYSAEDADSEGVEGKFYVWQAAEIRDVLGKEAPLFLEVFNVTEAGNFREEASGRQTGANILHMKRPLAELAPGLGMPAGELQERIERARARLFEARQGRVHPQKDDKILADWNGLMIAALARGARVLGRDEYAAAAAKAAGFIFEKMRGPDGRLLHRYRDGEAAIAANLDDYAFLAWGFLELYEATLEPAWLASALDLTRESIDRFWDAGQGGFFFAPADRDDLILRRKELYDGATPSGNSVAMGNLLRLSLLTGDAGLAERAAGVDRAFSIQVGRLPSAYTQFLVAVDLGLGPAHAVVVVGEPGGGDTAALLEALRGPFLPNTVVLFRPAGLEAPPITRLAPFAATHGTVDGKATAYVCSQTACAPPVTDPARLLELLR